MRILRMGVYLQINYITVISSHSQLKFEPYKNLVTGRVVWYLSYLMCIFSNINEIH